MMRFLETDRRIGLSPTFIAALTIAATAAVGFLSAFSIKIAVVALAVAAFFAILAAVWDVQRLFFAILAFSLAGYAFFGKPFAYIGARPVYLDEAVLFFAAAVVIVKAKHARLTPIHWLLVLFMLLGAVRTFPFVGRYGIDALRDAVLWGYGLIAVAVSFTARPEHFRWVTKHYRKAIPFFLVWAPVELVILSLFRSALPNIPGTIVPIIVVKGGDLAITLVGVGAFLLLGLYAEGRRQPSPREAGLWFSWVVSLLIASALSRGAFLASALSMAIAFFLQPSFRVAFITLTATFALVVGLLVVPDFQIRGDRTVSPQQLVLNSLSIVGASGNSALDTTKEWRLAWWTKIVDYTVFGQYFWTGKGFGINLANADGFQVTSDGSLRDPHNSHVSVLARMGVPGLALWVALQGTFGVTLFGAARRAWARHDQYWFQVDAWLLAYWLAIMIATSFDLYLEGPQVGVWFWVIFGLGIAAIRAQESSSQLPEGAADEPFQPSFERGGEPFAGIRQAGG